MLSVVYSVRRFVVANPGQHAVVNNELLHGPEEHNAEFLGRPRKDCINTRETVHSDSVIVADSAS